MRLLPSEEKNCGTCGYGSEGICYHCPGENYGHATEVSDKYICHNWWKAPSHDDLRKKER